MFSESGVVFPVLLRSYLVPRYLDTPLRNPIADKIKRLML